MHKTPINRREIMNDMLKENYLSSFYRAHLIGQILDLNQSTFSVFDYVNSFEEYIQCYDLVKNPFITIAQFI